MLKLFHDTVNDVAVFKTFHTGPDYHVRYGLEVTAYTDLDQAMAATCGCVRHAMAEHFDEVES